MLHIFEPKKSESELEGGGGGERSSSQGIIKIYKIYNSRQVSQVLQKKKEKLMTYIIM